MSELLQVLKVVEARLGRIERNLGQRSLNEVLVKSHYSCTEVAELSTQYGTKAAKAFTIRLACSDGRIPEAEKFEDGRWRIPRDSVLRILSVGLSPERRQHS